MSSKNKRNLSFRTSSAKVHRKYLGDPSDPHYVPRSPLIERQKFSSQDEAELKRLCSLALANVPHSDDMMDDPFRYLSSQISAKSRSKPAKQGTETKQQPPVAQRSAVIEEASVSNDSTATPSETSKRETLQSNITTPMTTPGVSPEETDKRFSESGKRPHTAHTSGLKAEIKPAKGNAVYAFLEQAPPSARPQAVTTRSLTHLPILSRNKSKSNIRESAGESILSHPDFNKSLPAIPKPVAGNPAAITTGDGATKEKGNGLARMLKTVGLSRASSTPEVPVRASANELPPRFSKIQSANQVKKHKFSLSSLFNKTTLPVNKRATVG